MTRFRQWTAVAYVACLSPAAVSAQATGTIAGMVVDPAGAAILGAEIAAGTVVARTDAFGRFVLVVPHGLSVLRVRRLGFEPLTVQTTLGSQVEQADLRLVLRPLATALAPVVVRTEKPRYTGRLSGYYRRLERRSAGTFIAREQIDRENPRMLSQLLAHVPGITATRMRGGGGGVRMRGRLCWPLVWLDGLPMGAGEVDLDAIPPHTIHGIELYLGSTTAPLGYIGIRSQSSCGTILLWSRGPDTDPPGGSVTPRFDIEKMVASLAVFTRDQVDEAATPVSPEQLEIQYPPELYASGEGGAVVAEFVVDERGKVEEGTFGIVSSTNPRLSEAVRTTVTSASFRPARKNGKPVRQVVQQPFSFTPRRSR